MRLRIQVRSYDAMCQMIAVNLGVGVLPLQACAPQIKAMDLKVIHLEDAWAKRDLLLAMKANGYQSPACALFSQHLIEHGL
jgi:DNA-binding transcriptional LysR family regulator